MTFLAYCRTFSDTEFFKDLSPGDLCFEFFYTFFSIFLGILRILHTDFSQLYNSSCKCNCELTATKSVDFAQLKTPRKFQIDIDISARFLKCDQNFFQKYDV